MRWRSSALTLIGGSLRRQSCRYGHVVGGGGDECRGKFLRGDFNGLGAWRAGTCDTAVGDWTTGGGLVGISFVWRRGCGLAHSILPCAAFIFRVPLGQSEAAKWLIDFSSVYYIPAAGVQIERLGAAEDANEIVPAAFWRLLSVAGMPAARCGASPTATGRTASGLINCEMEARGNGGHDQHRFQHGKRVADANPRPAAEREVSIGGTIGLLLRASPCSLAVRATSGLFTPALSRAREIGKPSSGGSDRARYQRGSR